ncbi:MAG TPA: long-chain fatty acid--CoA ligase [Syntrophales bacterium]|nr:long-chain fatty acid--CoA ligase [Syntrophales bacterium]
MAMQRPWFKSYHPNAPHEIEIEQITMPEVLQRTADRHPDTIALNYFGTKISFRRLNGLVNRLAQALLALGIKRDDKIAVLLPNMPQSAVANLAAMRIGAVPAMLNPLYTERELEYQINDAEAKMAITLDLLLPRMQTLKAKTGIGPIVTCHISDYLPFPKKQLFPYVKKGMFRKIEPQAGVYEFMDLIRKYPDQPVPNASRWDDIAVLIYTGGTTGVSKGVMLTQSNLCSNVQQFASGFHDVKVGERLMFIFPFFHSAGHLCMHLCLWMGMEDVLIPRPEPPIMADIIKNARPNYIGAVPTIYVGLLALEKFRKMDLSFIGGFVSGAAPLPVEIIEQLKQLTGSTMLEVYGLTETTPVVTATPWKGKIKVGTVGVPICNTDMKIVDVDTGQKELPPGEAGEICFKGPQVMKGYYRKPEETAMVLKDGWLYTGDIGVMDEDGYLSIVDRKKDVIIAGGFNIYPKEIDEVLFEHPKVLEACTIGVPDSYRGETVKAYIVVKAGQTLTAEEVTAFCKERLSPYKVPKQIEFIGELPKSAVGKILRRELRDLDKKKRETRQA